MFEDFWRVYPHHSARSKRAMAQAKWNAITGNGLETTVIDSERNSMRLNLKATPEEIVAGVKAYRMSLSQEDMRYAPGAQVWLNQGRWMDFENAAEVAQRYDRLQVKVTELQAAGKLRAVS